MAEQLINGQYIHVGKAGVFNISFTIPTAMVAADTVKVTTPSAAPTDVFPAWMKAAVLSGHTYTFDTDFPLVASTHNRASGETVFTATGNIAAGTKVLVGYVVAN